MYGLFPGQAVETELDPFLSSSYACLTASLFICNKQPSQIHII